MNYEGVGAVRTLIFVALAIYAYYQWGITEALLVVIIDSLADIKFAIKGDN